ncbi:outer membrane protein assembly factor BamE [Tropicimonas marinistellae]|uniref:outer membrane protein assembly factor BamE n=1 Tax=Tropicimonas marinistellae TaxID=1739787 RepID=UPI001F322CA1|nr:outer membrane protein assembly factor BamE [Tropicimonas marinistellae]
MARQRRAVMGRSVRALCATAALLAFSGCTPLYRDHGYVPSDDDLAEIVVGVDTRDTVADSVGTPSSSGVLRDTGYYYVSQRMRTYTYHEPEIVDRQIVAISFDRNGVVSNVERFALEDGNVVALSRRVTDSNVQGLGFLSQLFGNVGRFEIGENL